MHRPNLFKGHTLPLLHCHGKQMGNSDVCLSSALQSRFLGKEGQDVSGDLEEEGVILETSVRRLHSGKHSGHGNARRALTIANSVLKILELLSFSF